MARKAKRATQQRNEHIGVREFKNISIRFPGDVYILAAWIAMSDAAKSTPTRKSRTTLQGLARSFAMLHGTDYSNPLNAEDVMAAFREYGILGNPTLLLESTQTIEIAMPTKHSTNAVGLPRRRVCARIDEQSDARERRSQAD